MKKNLLSILILVLLIVNIALTAVMMISVTGVNKKTAELVTNIATVLNLELYNPGGVPVADVPLSETDVYDIAGITVPLKMSVNEDGTTSSKQNYFIFDLSLSQDMRHEDYKTYGGADNLATRVSLIQDKVAQVVGSHTLEECQSNLDGIRDEILQEIQNLFDSNFIFKIGFSNMKY